MKYEWIELQNYAGIYNGMQLYQIKINFSNCKTNKILIRGINGSGKSTLMNAINVHPDTNDKFIPNAEARKNLGLLCNGIHYIIRYIHPVTNSGRGTTKGYISKSINGQMVELNPNGNISSCRDILYEEFNLDANFMALSQLSSEDRGLVDRKPAERKKLLNGIIDTLETYNNIYRVLNKRSSVFKSMTNSLAYKIESIGEETKLQLNLKAYENRIAKLEDDKNTLIESIAAKKVKISEYIDILQKNNYDAIMIELDSLSKSNKLLSNQIQKSLSEYKINDISKVSEFLDYLNRSILELESSIDSNRKQLALMLAQKESEFKDLEEKNARLNALQSDYNYIEIKNAKLEAERIVEEYDKVFKEMHLRDINIITKSEFDSAMESLKYLKSIAFNILSNYNLDDIEFVYNNIKSIKDNYLSIKDNKIKLSNLKDEKSDLEKRLFEFEAMRKIADNLKQRPSDCNIDTCPYISDAIDANNKYPEFEYNNLKNKISILQQHIHDIESFIDTTELYNEIIKQFDIIDREIKSKISFISKLPVANNFAETFIYRVVSGDSFKDIDELYAYADCGNMIDLYKNAKQNLHRYNLEYKIYESKNEIIESVMHDIESLNLKIDNISKDIEDINNSINISEKKLIVIKNSKEKINYLYDKINNDYIPSMDRQKELSSIKNSLEDNNIKINTLQNELNILSNRLGSINSDIKKETSERDELRHAAQLLVDYKAEYEIYMKKYTKIEKIKYYASPSTGIQTIFMELYMNKIISIANKLLSLLFEGEFALQPFIINESEFRIPCLGNGLIHDDISSMSTAQKCMISMILSFSLLYQSSTKYNVIKLDELDAFLDTNNRGYFINLLDQLMNLLSCEQCFIVSHNNELSSYNCDIILLKNNNYNVTDNENIIWQY